MGQGGAHIAWWLATVKIQGAGEVLSLGSSSEAAQEGFGAGHLDIHRRKPGQQHVRLRCVAPLCADPVLLIFMCPATCADRYTAV